MKAPAAEKPSWMHLFTQFVTLAASLVAVPKAFEPFARLPFREFYRRLGTTPEAVGLTNQEMVDRFLDVMIGQSGNIALCCSLSAGVHYVSGMGAVTRRPFVAKWREERVLERVKAVCAAPFLFAPLGVLYSAMGPVAALVAAVAVWSILTRRLLKRHELLPLPRRSEPRLPHWQIAWINGLILSALTIAFPLTVVTLRHRPSDLWIKLAAVLVLVLTFALWFGTAGAATTSRPLHERLDRRLPLSVVVVVTLSVTGALTFATARMLAPVHAERVMAGLKLRGWAARAVAGPITCVELTPSPVQTSYLLRLEPSGGEFYWPNRGPVRVPAGNVVLLPAEPSKCRTSP
jgi:hypothetical protein